MKITTGILFGVGFAACVLCSEKAKAENFYDLNYPWNQGKKVESFLDSKTWTCWDNLKYRTDPNDASGASDQLVSKTGYYNSTKDSWIGEIWDVAFLERFYDNQGNWTGWDFVGYANNDNINSNSFNSHNYPAPYHLDGWLNGYYYNNWGAMPVGDSPDDVFVVHDQNGDGVGNVVGGTWTLGGDDILYATNDILFASGPQKNDFRRGDVSSLPVYPYSGLTVSTLPNMVISPFRLGDAVYSAGKRVDKEGPADLVNLSSSWMTNGHSAQDYWANGADHNTDGNVDFNDFAIMSQNWSPSSDYLKE